MKLRIYSISLGCPKNRVDTERLLASVQPLEVVPEFKNAQVVFINTCGFILPAVQESVQTILEVAADIAELPAAQRPLLAVGGCLPGRYGVEALQKDLPEVDLWLNLEDLPVWPLLLQKAASTRFANDLNLTLTNAPERRYLSTAPSFAYLKISEGCARNCAFCTIPMIRGPLRSFAQASLLKEASYLVQTNGVKELVLVAQDLTVYGQDRKEKDALPRLLEELMKLPGLARLRLMYLYPSGLTKELLGFLGGLGAPLLPYFDVPLQHSHPDVLSRMGRPFAQNPERVLDLVREVFPGSAIRTSLITGFPGEERHHFEHLLNFVEKARFDNLGVFTYFAEEGTRAAALPAQVEESVKKERRELIMQLQASISEEKLAARLGDKVEVLVDSPQGEWPGLFIGRTWFQAPDVDGITYISGSNLAPGDLVNAEIGETHTYDLTALV